MDTWALMSALLESVENSVGIEGAFLQAPPLAIHHPLVWISPEARLQGESGSPMSPTSAAAEQWSGAHTLSPLRFE